MITIKGLRKAFGDQIVLDNLELEIPAGQATGIVGPNGSGKTTMIKHVLGLVKADEGTITVNGTKLNGHSDYRSQIGYMPQMARYPENMRVSELLDFIKEIRGVEETSEDELIELFELENELHKPLRTLSGGNRQKVGATLAFMFNPKIIILDEPTAGLDPKSSVRFKKLIREEKANGKTILLTTHIMSEIEELADHLIFLVEGKVRYDGPMSELMNLKQEDRLESAVAKMMEEAA
ncbi:ABC transporter ATP-binding protein [Aliifodinibius sp. S!AR15-10]|uniref:ABC transporter ATP-binding protein n=1 Tax=Aliifodinibius sp. S!AR15-10 TaxID=2950437 RepID=UPI0028655A3D|nr:ABC transporter ATP-binding protein [Aliifodinibius sp. S!AR15-10]MDR8393179.1 ABC transporter ATP-binding protein [Aliifodinibius sp. S!AR15-10]